MNILREEKKLWRKGFKRVAGLDEAGRGPLAGPVVAAAVIIQSTLGHSPTGEAKYKIQNTRIRDSKQLSAKQRDIFFQLITKNKNIKWGIGRVSEKVIDKINILEATKLAMIKAVKNLEKRSVKKSHDRGKFCHRDFLVLDGNFTLPAEALAKAGINPLISQKSIIKGDEKVFSVAAASILAKVARDRIMVCCHKKYPQYRFDIHKGYPTKYHCKMIRKYGPCKIHRKTFAPLKRFS
jgi:ribonuclease HII